MNKKIPELEPQSQEFTLPFVGREEELQFLLCEYDQMLHAQYRSVWLEAPAGMGKTTLVEEFLKRVDVAHPASAGCATSPLKPWIVHAHLRERSSNSLASFVEALGVALQTLTEAQREKIFSGLTNFYQERARRIVGGGNVQSMDMEEAITTAGYVIKRLSFYFPVVVIIEDIHVLKGDVSFYALRHLLAIIEHVPTLALFISRPSEEKNLKQFHDQLIKEGCKKYKVESLKYEAVKELAAGKGEKEVKELLHLSGGNALLLRELLRSGDLQISNKTNSTAERIVSYLLKELQKLPKKDRQVVAIAGMLGEEFSEQLLYEIAIAKDFKCWSHDVLERLEHKGILHRRKKILKPEGAQKEITLSVSVFTHALWWEAARALYPKENEWTNRKFAETIVPFLSHEDYPLLTDAELIANLLQWLPQKKLVPLLDYVGALCSLHGRWHFHSYEEQIKILHQAHQVIQKLYGSPGFILKKETMWVMVHLIEIELFLSNVEKINHIESLQLTRELLQEFIEEDPKVFEYALDTCIEEMTRTIMHHADKNGAERAWEYMNSLNEILRRKDWVSTKNNFNGYRLAIMAIKEYYSCPQNAAKYFFEAIAIISKNTTSALRDIEIFLGELSNLSLTQQEFLRCLTIVAEVKTELLNFAPKELVENRLDTLEVGFLLRMGRMEKMGYFVSQMVEIEKTSPWLNEQYLAKTGAAVIYSFEGEEEKFFQCVRDIFSESFSGIDYGSRCKAIYSYLFLIEDWNLAEKIWDTTLKNHLFPFRLFRVAPLICKRVLSCMLLGNNNGKDEAIALLEKFKKKYPVMKNTIEIHWEKMKPFLLLTEKSSSNGRKKFEKFLSGDQTLSPFDKAVYSQLFARIGVRSGHDPKNFISYAEYSLQEFAKLGLGKRVLFTAEKLAEANLISENKLSQLRKKYKGSTSKETVVKNSNTATRSIESSADRVANNGEELNKERITLHCMQELKATLPDGKELVSTYWGKRQKGNSRHKLIVLELVRARLEKRSVTRENFIAAIFPEAKRGNVSAKSKFRMERTLSACLSQLRRTFAPYELFEHDEEGYRLQTSVSIDLLEAEGSLVKAKQLAQKHPPSALWLLQSTGKNVGSNQNFLNTDKAFTQRIKILRKELSVLKTSIESRNGLA